MHILTNIKTYTSEILRTVRTGNMFKHNIYTNIGAGGGGQRRVGAGAMKHMQISTKIH